LPATKLDAGLKALQVGTKLGATAIMRTITLDDLLSRIEERKRLLGLADTAATTEALRNKGGSRSPEKRELLRRAELRARQAGRKPITSY
jgi:hypothetical protein